MLGQILSVTSSHQLMLLCLLLLLLLFRFLGSHSWQKCPKSSVATPSISRKNYEKSYKEYNTLPLKAHAQNLEATTYIASRIAYYDSQLQQGNKKRRCRKHLATHEQDGILHSLTMFPTKIASLCNYIFIWNMKTSNKVARLSNSFKFDLFERRERVLLP